MGAPGLDFQTWETTDLDRTLPLARTIEVEIAQSAPIPLQNASKCAQKRAKKRPKQRILGHFLHFWPGNNSTFATFPSACGPAFSRNGLDSANRPACKPTKPHPFVGLFAQMRVGLQADILDRHRPESHPYLRLLFAFAYNPHMDFQLVTNYKPRGISHERLTSWLTE